MSKFEKLIEYVVAEDMEKARELFHELCVEKSREIYENLLDEEELDEADEEVTEAEDEDLDESEEEVAESEDEDLDESFIEEEGDDFSDKLPADDMIDDIKADEAGMALEGGEEDDLEDRMVDVEDALDELEAKFAEIVDGGEYGDEDEMGDDELGMEFDGEEGDDEEFGDEEEGGDFDMPEDDMEESADLVREYTEKVGPAKSEDPGKGHGPVAKNGKNPTGGKNSIDIGKGSMTDNATPSSGDFAGGVNTEPGKRDKVPAAKSEDPGKGKGPVPKSHNK